MSGYEIAAILLASAVLVVALAFFIKHTGFYWEVEMRDESKFPDTQQASDE